MKPLMTVIAALLCVSVCIGAEPTKPTLDDLIPKSQQSTMGIQKLSPDEKEALRQHIMALIKAASVAIRSLETTPAPKVVVTNQPLTVTKSPPSQKRIAPVVTSVVVDPAYSLTGGGHWVSQNIDSGEFILLEDDSLWQIDPLDKIDASLWLSTSNIRVIESSDGSPGYDYLLINTDDGEKAHAKYRGSQ